MSTHDDFPSPKFQMACVKSHDFMCPLIVSSFFTSSFADASHFSLSTRASDYLLHVVPFGLRFAKREIQKEKKLELIELIE